MKNIKSNNKEFCKRNDELPCTNVDRNNFQGKNTTRNKIIYFLWMCSSKYVSVYTLV